MNKKIIIFSGKQLSGKDCVAKMLLGYLTDFKRIGLGDAIKLEYFEKTGITLDEIEQNKAQYRNDLIELGNKRRSEDPDYWIKKVINFPYNCIVPDMRMKRELDFFKAANAFTVRVESSLESRIARGTLMNQNDITETDLDDVLGWDYVIHNDGTIDDLKQEVSKLYEYLKENYFHRDLGYPEFF